MGQKVFVRIRQRVLSIVPVSFNTGRCCIAVGGVTLEEHRAITTQYPSFQMVVILTLASLLKLELGGLGRKCLFKPTTCPPGCTLASPRVLCESLYPDGSPDQ